MEDKLQACIEGICGQNLAQLSEKCAELRLSKEQTEAIFESMVDANRRWSELWGKLVSAIVRVLEEQPQ